MFINITRSETGDNKGSCGALVQYLEKENRLSEIDTSNQADDWFNGSSDSIKPFQVRTGIDNNVFNLGRKDNKFFLINISPSQKEIAHLTESFGEDVARQKLKEFACSIMDEYAKNFKRTGIDSHQDLIWFGKLEKYRYYKIDDKQVKDGSRKRGEQKEGPQMHIQIIVSRKDATGKIKLSPQNTSRGRNDKHSSKMGQFDRRAFKLSGEIVFDQMFGFHRPMGDSFAQVNILKNGSIEQKLAQHKLEKFGSNDNALWSILSSSAAKLSHEIMMEGKTVSYHLQSKIDDLLGSHDVLKSLEMDNQSMNPTQNLMLNRVKRKKKKHGLNR